MDKFILCVVEILFGTQRLESFHLFCIRNFS